AWLAADAGDLAQLGEDDDGAAAQLVAGFGAVVGEDVGEEVFREADVPEDAAAEEGGGQLGLDVAGDDDAGRGQGARVGAGGALHHALERHAVALDLRGGADAHRDLGDLEGALVELAEQVVGQVAGGFVDLVDEDGAAAGRDQAAAERFERD